MASFVVVAGLLAVWIFAAAVIGLALGRMVRMRDLQHPGPAPRRAADPAGTGRTVASRADALGD
jgi:hypothetical protein